MKKEIKNKRKRKNRNILIIVITLIICSTSKVNAETFNVNPHVSIGGYTVPTYWGINANTTTNLVIKLEDWQGYSQTFNANFGYFEVCANFPVKFNNNNADCSDGCFASEFNTYNTGSSCKIYDTNYEGTKYYVFFSIKEYGYKNADTLPIVYDTFSFNNPYSYSVYFSLDNSYLSNEDLYLNFADQIRNEQLQQETNNKLDTQIGQNETIIDQNQEIIDEENETQEKLEEQTQQDKEQHDEFMNSDIDEDLKELPDDSKYQDYTDTENSLKDKVNEADMSVISIGIDGNSSLWIWNTLTSLIQTHSTIFGMFIAILSIGIIKLALGR